MACSEQTEHMTEERPEVLRFVRAPRHEVPVQPLLRNVRRSPSRPRLHAPIELRCAKVPRLRGQAAELSEDGARVVQHVVPQIAGAAVGSAPDRQASGRNLFFSANRFGTPRSPRGAEPIEGVTRLRDPARIMTSRAR